MTFYLLLGLINLACFLPLYLLNVRDAPNPLGFLAARDPTADWWPLKLMYFRYHSPDPFRVHFDFTLVALLASAAGATGPAARLLVGGVLAFGFVEILYTTIMHSVFKRAPALASDLSLLRSGLVLAQRRAYWMVALALSALGLTGWAATASASALLGTAPVSRWPLLLLAAALVPPCFYHAERAYDLYVWRTVYSPALHLALNLRFSALLKRLYDRDAAHYRRYNFYRDVRLQDPPDVVVVCVESYGSLVFRDPGAGDGIPELLRPLEAQLVERGYGVASTLSEAPLLAGGSWLSYTSFLYGTLIDDLQLYDGLFSHESGFAAYESLFQILRRNGYENVLLCPLGGVDRHTLNWDSLDRCFHSQRRIGIDDLGYAGPTLNYLGVVRRFSPLDQFSLNHGYESARSGGRPFSLFFCTLNSHYPWPASPVASDDWRGLNAGAGDLVGEPGRTALERYNAAIRYQLDYIFRFIRDQADDAPLVIVFGDHQPPFITSDELGGQTPVHVISKSRGLLDAFLSHGFAGTLDLTDVDPRSIRHEAFLSLLMQGLQSAYGADAGVEISYRERGARVFEDARAGLLRTR